MLPLGFGNTFIDEGRVRWLLARYYSTFKAYLRKIEGKVEVGVKVFYDLDVAKRELEAACSESEGRKELSASVDVGEDYYKRISEKAY